ncbi:cupin domain-containing protein [Amylibacter sp.]|nr:cupin domain-containing protein [Amylibacter sp.]
MDYKDYIKGGMPNFPNITDMGPRPWGTEELLVLVPGKYMLKKLSIKAGSKGGLQYHRLKDECGYLISGKLIVRHEDETGKIVERVVNAGESFHFPPGIVHQEEAIEDCVIIEGSTPHFNDRVRMEEFFGLGKPEGMPTTSMNDIETL